MRIKLVLNGYKEFVELPLHYNSIVQGILYRSLPKFLSEFLHEIGFFYNGRRFKLFTFSRIFSEKFIIDRKKKKIRYKNPITIYVSSGVSDITKNWGENFLKKEKINLGTNKLFLESIEILEQPEFKEEILIKTLSPITVYRTFANEKKFYRYYTPDEREFCELLKENLRKKYSILSG
ncbi:CRISPR-associated endoribonuclease Cas6, partial [Persephonella sp.]